MTYVPPSTEVLTEEILDRVADEGLPREEQGEIVKNFVSAVADEIRKLLQVAYVG